MVIIGNDCTSGFYCNYTKQPQNNVFSWSFILYDIYIDIIYNFDNINFDNARFVYYEELDCNIANAYKNNTFFDSHPYIENMIFCIIDDKYTICYPHYIRKMDAKKPLYIGVDVYYKDMLNTVKEHYYNRLKRMKAIDKLDYCFLLVESEVIIPDYIIQKFNNFHTNNLKVLLRTNKPSFQIASVKYIKWIRKRAIFDNDEMKYLLKTL